MVQLIEEMDEVVRGKQEEKQDLESMSKTVLNISQVNKEIGEADAQVERIISQQQSSGTVRSTQEIHELQDRCTEQMKAIKNGISKLSSERQRLRDLINSLELERSRLSNSISNAARQLERKKSFQDQIQAQKDDMSKQKEAIQEADRELGLVEPEIAKAKAIREDTLQRGRAKEKKAAEERDGLAASVNELKLINNDIQAYLDRGGPSLLAANERAIQSLDTAIKNIEKDMNDLTARTNKIKEEIDNSEGRKKNIMDNLTYRKTLREVNQFKREIEELESRNANEDYERLDHEAKEWESRRHRLNAEKGVMMGTMRTKDNTLARLLVEWETDYEDAARKYRETHIKVETTKAAIEDLGKYGTALSNAIMRYHALKMEEVNRIAGELWQGTYQGTDIDTILIKSDTEVSGRSTYNYRVCMVKQDTEMDMRGRCSAGQKVLASIIIRLALAESFGVGCGLIALDEPTTNLDRDNIRSLAESLHSIINARKAQANFQLIVITHDEEFLRHMRCSDFCDHFYRVKRNDRQTSIIERENISTVV
ncbi:P-loop containing nucleoside triphosphate hydrolase protein [Hypoxylon fragiforme]|uniref:P-loop containing nucleoside triphosphate hydrolase protein n=1 Tax=Hypoxylon fragiforme TaxID=63214 RepID=UPI0020C7415A|nr:P-loop containing nucleoside triphosphate hydrolase protein [Hypoxylon fragiforme]KAI2603823.1 P-loop containing nucleoside triphosphate hydrolase protein [Hypoxylon fragiforme]